MIRSTLDQFFHRVAPIDPGDLVLVAFSAGPDSTALLWGLREFAETRRLRLHAAHLDHALDAGSAERARRAARIATELGVPCTSERLDPPPVSPPGGLEDWARRQRYGFLERERLRLGARYVATAHHRDDQLETVLLRWLMGSGLEGLGAIQAKRGALVRPLLRVDRATLRRSLGDSGLEPVDDPTNLDPKRLRNRIRHHLAPRLLRSDPDLGERLVRLATSSRAASASIERRLRPSLDPRPEVRGASIDLAALRALPDALRPFALALASRVAERPYPPGRAARRELGRQLERAGRIGCHCGEGWQWRDRRGRLLLTRLETTTMPFAYTLRVPGEVVIPPLGLRLRIAREPLAAWMFEGHPRRAALELPTDCSERLEVRNRRPGDRVRPFGCPYTRRLKDVLIDRGVPRWRRDSLPLLCREDRILWVPGVTIDDGLRIGAESEPWVARLEPLEG